MRAPVVLLAVITACGGGLAPRTPTDAHRLSSSNVLRADYAGSAVCATCHPREAEGWARSPMRRMTRDLPGADVRAPFDGRVFRFKDDSVTLSSLGSKRVMELRARGEVHTYAITRVIGGRVREDFVGREDAGPELVMPVSYLLASGKLRYKGYSVMTRERPGLKAGPVWSETCIFCHNTAPYVLDLLAAFREGKAPPYQGEIVDALLPPARQWRYRVTDEDALRAALSTEMDVIGGAELHGRGRDLLDLAISSTRAAFGGSDLLEVGIGCEACHNGARAHAARPSDKPDLAPRAPFFAVEGDLSPAAKINRVCARCHQVLFTRYPFTWEGKTRDKSPGGSHINSGEARDFLLGGCASALACTRCHEPHDGASTVDLETKRGDLVCTACHPKYAGDEAVRAHAHHDPDKLGARCVSCHMPRKNMSLDGALARYHRIASPTEDAKVTGDRPLECALCHPRASVESLVSTMESWWGKRYDRAALASLYGSLVGEAPKGAMVATLARGKPHEKAVALHVLGEERDPALRGLFEAELTSEYPLVAGYAERALEKLQP